MTRGMNNGRKLKIRRYTDLVKENQRLKEERNEYKRALEAIASMKDDWGMLYANQVMPIVNGALAAIQEESELPPAQQNTG